MRFLGRTHKRIVDAKARLMTLMWYRWLFMEMGTKCSVTPPFFTVGPERIKLGHRVWIGPGCRLEVLPPPDGADRKAAGAEPKPAIVIGSRVNISHRVTITAVNRVKIGDETIIAPGCYISDNSHATDPEGPAYRDQPLAVSETVIGKGVWLGQNVCVLAGSTIGDRAVIGANSVVKGDIPPYSMAAGAPARVVRVYDFAKKAWVRPEPDGNGLADRAESGTRSETDRDG